MLELAHYDIGGIKIKRKNSQVRYQSTCPKCRRKLVNTYPYKDDWICLKCIEEAEKE